MFGENVFVQHPDEGMLSVKVGRKRSICTMEMRGRGGGWAGLRNWENSKFVYHLKRKQMLRKLVKYM